jgi:hypothetical protein
LNQPIEDEGGFSMHQYRKALVNSCLSLKDFNYNLSMALIQSSSDPYFQNVLIADRNRTRAAEQCHQDGVIGQVITRNPDTLCIVGKTIFRCEVCKVALCKTAKDKSHKNMNCFYIWHNSVDLIIEHNKIKQAYKKCNTTQNNATRETSSEDEVVHDDKSHEGLKNSTPIGNLKTIMMKKGKPVARPAKEKSTAPVP